MAKKRRRRHRQPSAATHAVPATYRTIPPLAEPLRAPRVDRTRNWYAVRVRTGRERAVAKRLDRLQGAEPGIAIENPLIAVDVVRKGAPAQVIRSALPGYLLAGMDPIDPQFGRLLDTDDVIGIVRPSVDYQPLRPDTVQSYLDELEKVAGQMAEGPPPKVQVGQSVKIARGPWASFPGVVMELVSSNGAKVEVPIFGRAYIVVLDLAELEAA